jgi:enoyl-CoA hydratase/carnithine racemase
MPISAEQAERWGLVNHVVEEGEVLRKAQEVAEAIVKENQDLVLRYKAVINDGLKLDLGHALSLEKVVICSLF